MKSVNVLKGIEGKSAVFVEISRMKKFNGGIFYGGYPSAHLSRESELKKYAWHFIHRKREGWNYREETFDNILLVIAKEVEKNLLVKHYAYQDKKAALYIVDEEQLKEWLLLGTNRKILNWLSDGKIVFDRNDYVHRLKNELREPSANERNLKMAIEFSKIIKSYTDGKAFFHNGHYMDAYHHISRSLYHLACLAIIEKGFQPEQTMWDQVKQLNPEIYKLYEELLTSNENIEKRLELLFLASEFLIHSHTESGVSHFLNVLRKKTTGLLMI